VYARMPSTSSDSWPRTTRMPAARRRRRSQHEGPVKAILHSQYGASDLLQFKEIDKPAPKDNEVLIAIHATTVSTANCDMRNFTFAMPVRTIGGARMITGARRRVAGRRACHASRCDLFLERHRCRPRRGCLRRRHKPFLVVSDERCNEVVGGAVNEAHAVEGDDAGR
jgi:hypothetical protein